MGDYRTVITVNLKMRYDRQAYNKAYYAEHREEQKAKSKTYAAGHREESKAYAKAYRVEYYADPKNRIKKLVSDAKRRKGEVESGLYEALIANIPTLCPVCEVQIDWGMGKERRRRNSPSLDRRDNDLGYTIANTCLICSRCNMLKSDASPAKIQRLALYMETQA